jgi:pimeloyl-ACP methyl ester carboxylesterase
MRAPQVMAGCVRQCHTITSVQSEQAFVRVSGDGLLWTECAGSGVPVVLMHGAGMDSRLWDVVFPALACHHRVIRYDARGLGRSATPAGPFSDVADLREVLDHYGVERTALVGMSMGGEAALDFTLAYPGRVSALVLVGASVSGYHWPHTPDLAAYASARRIGDADRLAELELAVWAALRQRAPGWPAIVAMVRQNAKKRFANEKFALYPDQNALPRLRQIEVPTLVMHGADDHPEIGVIAAAISGQIPAARCQIVAAADHYLPLRAPADMTQLLLDHLKRAITG